MCRSTEEGGRRCERCNDPIRRRNRQNLAYSVKKSATAVAEKPGTDTTAGTENAEPNSLAELVARDLKERHEDTADIDETVMADTIASMLADPKVGQAMSEELRNERLTADNHREWVLNGREDTPENFAAGLAERQDQILMVGTVIAERAQAIHGLNVDEERAKWHARVEEAQAHHAELRAKADKLGADWHARRKEFMEEYGFSSYLEMRDGLSPEHQQENEDMQTAYRRADGESFEASAKASRILRGDDEETIKVLDKISEGNRQAIAEMRPVGNETVQFREAIRGGKDAGEIFRSTVSQVFPDDWVKSSNELGNLALKRVTKGSGRAHYRGALKAEYRFTHTGKPFPGDSRFEGWTEKLDENGNPTGKWHGPKRDFLEQRNALNWKKYDGNTPKGKGWKRGYAQNRYGGLTEGWVRDNATDAKLVNNREAEITLNVNDNDRERRRVVAHEFSHRVENANPHITVMEEAFVASRTTLPNGKREPLRYYKYGKAAGIALRNTGKSEVLREDDFVDPYMGKEYTDSYREILSMGSESVFGGSKGGLVGIGHERSDPQMRNWILGVYATM